MIYDVNGNALNSAYDKNGSIISKVYNKHGEEIPLTPDPFQMTVMAFNVGSFYTEWHPAPVEAGDVFLERNENIFDNYDLDFAGLSEWYKYIGNNESATLMDEFFHYWHPDYRPYEENDSALTIGASAEITETRLVKYTTQGSQTRYYLKAYINFHGRKICCVLTHMDLTASARAGQFLELMNAMENEEYFIALGDFNFTITSVGDTEYNNSIQVALNKGFHSAQNANSLLMTHYNGKTVASSSESYALDNIITSSNITINSVARDETKLTDGLCEQYDIIIDHLPIVAELTVT